MELTHHSVQFGVGKIFTSRLPSSRMNPSRLCGEHGERLETVLHFFRNLRPMFSFKSRCDSPLPFPKFSSQSRVTNKAVIANEFLKISSPLLWKTTNFSSVHQDSSLLDAKHQKCSDSAMNSDLAAFATFARTSLTR